MVLALLIVASAVVFVGSLIVSMSDGQGAFVFIIAWPLLAVLLGLALTLSRRRGQRGFRVAAGWTVFVLLFFVLLPFPIVGAVSQAIMTGVGKAFVLLTGKTPYAYFRARNDVRAMVEAQLAESDGRVIDFSRVNPRYTFDRVCVFPPYSDELTVRAILGFDLSRDWKLGQYSPIATDDGINLIVLTDKQSVSYTINLPRSKADLSAQGARCLERASALFKHVPGEGNGHVFRN